MRARRRTRLDLAFCAEYLTITAQGEQVVPLVEARLSAALGQSRAPGAPSVPDAFAQATWGFLRTTRMTRCGLVHLLLRVVKQRVGMGNEGPQERKAREGAPAWGFEEWETLPGPSLGDYEYHAEVSVWSVSRYV